MTVHIKQSNNDFENIKQIRISREAIKPSVCRTLFNDATLQELLTLFPFGCFITNRIKIKSRQTQTRF